MSESNSVKVDVFNKALDHAALEVDSWIALLQIDYKNGLHMSADKENAKREYGNINRILTGISKNIRKMKIAIPTEEQDVSKAGGQGGN